MDLLERLPFEEEGAGHGVSDISQGITGLRLAESSQNEYHNYFAELPQEIIDNIARNLDLKTIVRLQSTCRGLYPKCYVAQQLITFYPEHASFVVMPPMANVNQPMKILYSEGKSGEDTRITATFTVEQFKATDFRFKCRRLTLIEPVTTDMINSVTSCFKGREVFEFLFIHKKLDTGPEVFNQMLVDLEVKEFVWGVLPVEWFELPAVKKFVRLHSETCPPRLSYLLDSAAHSICFDLADDEDRPDAQDMHDILAQWAAGERDIKEYNITNFNVEPFPLIGDWPFIAEGDEMPEERPVFIWVGDDVRFRIVRSDGEELRVFICGFHNSEDKHKHEISIVDKDHPPWCGGSRTPVGEGEHDHEGHDHSGESADEEDEEESQDGGDDEEDTQDED